MLPIHRTNTWLPDVFNDLFFNDFTPRVSNTSPAINVIESEKEYKVELAAPGMKKEDFDVQINENGDLHIKLENKQEKKDEDKNTHYLRREFSYTKFEQTLILPEDVDKEKISAKVEHGVLTVDLPKIEQKPTPKIGRKVEVI
ncbi:MAG: Hsp20/alpha crystallin family protein [Bacteroidaceae bacterium]|nr:Hsp20/alpha crystallin family protein [Bacteroidaceae bacterium]MBO7557647.1 Hsp20/alpha crystallin family protein [Bacteroidaceae bacterium]MBQ2339362.1 Hsp20/alpha crystallin family protein [Bacteroidaceae bacterium]MBQ3627870.1 Hsp20/alpha crystallin family protein [Bacteroidaceae bacterium]